MFMVQTMVIKKLYISFLKIMKRWNSLYIERLFTEIIRGKS